MKLYAGFAPNALRLTIFLREKGLDIPVTPVNVLDGDTRTEKFLALNPLGEIPVVELDDGTILTESIAICRYFEALHPAPSLFGVDAKSQAVIEMWNRRMELKVFNTIGDFTRHEFQFFADRGQVPAFAELRRNDFASILNWLDRELADGRPFIAGEAFSVADITGMVTLVLALFAHYDVGVGRAHLSRWAESMRGRPSFPEMPRAQAS